MHSCHSESLTRPAVAQFSRFQGESGTNEYHIAVIPTQYGDVRSQLRWIESSYRALLDDLALDVTTCVFRRFFCSDLVNQAGVLSICELSKRQDRQLPCAVSWTGQPAAPPAKVAMWAYHVRDSREELSLVQTEQETVLHRGSLDHHWVTGLNCPSALTPCRQTDRILAEYCDLLQKRQMRLADHVVRTWFFVTDIDANYRGLVEARRAFFVDHGLTPQTHFIASTGIGGAAVNPTETVTMDAYAIRGLKHEQVSFLAVPGHMSPTHLYGVTFERGTAISFRDRKHVYLSGTASIDHQGLIVHPGNVARQFDRTIENAEAVLAEAGASLDDLSLLLVYLRDPCDYELVGTLIRHRFADKPVVVSQAPVCRPGWLVEIEGVAIPSASNPTLPPF